MVGTRFFYLTSQHEVVAVDGVTGQVSWRRQTGQQAPSTEGSRITVAGNVVVAGDYDLFAFNAVNGALAWAFRPDVGYGPGYYLGDSYDDLVVSGSPANRVYAVDARTGALRWSTSVSQAEKTTVFAPSISGGLVIAGYTEFTAPARGGVVALREHDGSIAWNYRFPGTSDETLATNVAGGPVIAGARVFVASGDGSVFALDRTTGTVTWRVTSVDVSGHSQVDPRRDFRSLAVERGTLVVTSLTGVVLGLSAESGAERWRVVAARDSAALELSSGRGVVALPHLSGAFTLLSVLDGSTLWRLPFSVGLSWPALFTDELIVVGGRSGLWAFPLEKFLPAVR